MIGAISRWLITNSRSIYFCTFTKWNKLLKKLTHTILFEINLRSLKPVYKPITWL